jgi:hypothetical protein
MAAYTPVNRVLFPEASCSKNISERYIIRPVINILNRYANRTFSTGFTLSLLVRRSRMAYPGIKKERIIAAPNVTICIIPMAYQLVYMCPKSGFEKTEQITRDTKNTKIKMIFEMDGPPSILFLPKSIFFEESLESLLPYRVSTLFLYDIK